MIRRAGKSARDVLDSIQQRKDAAGKSDESAKIPAHPVLPHDAKARKEIPVYSGFVAYFPRAMAEVAKISRAGNEQHNPGTPLHWDRSKSGDEKDAMMRHILEGDWGQVAWRAMANLEKELEQGYTKAVDKP